MTLIKLHGNVYVLGELCVCLLECIQGERDRQKCFSSKPFGFMNVKSNKDGLIIFKIK